MEPASTPASRRHGYGNFEDEKEFLYSKIEQHEGVDIPRLEAEVEEHKGTIATKNSEISKLENDRRRFEKTFREIEGELEKVKQDYEQSKIELQGAHSRLKIEESRSSRAESKAEELAKKHKVLAGEFDELTAMKDGLHHMVDDLQQTLKEAHQEIEKNDHAVQRLQEFDDILEEIFQEFGLQLTPKSLFERFTSMHDKSKRDASEHSIDRRPARRPSLSGRKVSVASIGDELNAIESDGDSDAGSASPLAHVKSRMSKGDRQHRASTGSEPNGHHPGSKRSIAQEVNDMFVSGEGLDESWSAVDSASPVMGGPDRLMNPDIQDPMHVDNLPSSEPAGNTKSTKSIESQKGTNDLTMNEKQASDEAHRKRIAELENERSLQEKKINELQQSLKSRPKPTTTSITRPIFCSVVPDATFAELLERAPWWLKLAMVFMLLCWAALTVSAWRERNLWLASNDTTFLYGRRLQATTSQCHWAIIEWFENYIGVDKRLLG